MKRKGKKRRKLREREKKIIDAKEGNTLSNIKVQGLDTLMAIRLTCVGPRLPYQSVRDATIYSNANQSTRLHLRPVAAPSHALRPSISMICLPPWLDVAPRPRTKSRGREELKLRQNKPALVKVIYLVPL